MSLSLVQLEHRLIAFPSLSILESLPYHELEWISEHPATVAWREQSLPVISLADLLPCPQLPFESINPRVALVVAGSATPFIIPVNGLVGERLLIIKPFAQTFMTPPYLAGCTILGNGDIVPVFLPETFVINSSISRQSSPNTIKTPTILIAEDSVATRRLLERLLTQVGCITLICRDGQEALNLLAQHSEKINLVISDIEMPRLNGFELLQQIRSHPKWHNLPVILVTSRTSDRHIQQARQLGVSAYLGKPIQTQELLTTVEALL